MMRRLAWFTAILIFGSGPLAAQSVWLGGGPTFPMSDFSSYAKTGWMASAGVGFGLGSGDRLSLQLEGVYGSNNHDTEGDKTNLYGGLVNVAYQLGNTGKLHPYAFGGVGVLAQDFSSENVDDENEGSAGKMAYQFGAGLDIPLGKLGLWVDVRYLARAESYATAVIPVMAGIYVPFGKD